MRQAFCALALSLTLAGCSVPPENAVRLQSVDDYAQQRHPFERARLFLDRHSAAAQWQSQHDAPWLDPITLTPQAVWLTSEWDLAGLPDIVQAAQEQEALLVVVAYFIPNRDCAGQGADSVAHYRAWIDRLADKLGKTPAVVVMEPDALAADCFDAERARALAEGVTRLADAGHYVYLDAGHPQWRTTAEAARRLLLSGIRQANGFSINVSNRQTTQESERWGLELSNLVGDREFIIDTSRNGLGAPPDEPGRDDEWCNPYRQALGTRPMTLAPPMLTAALLWIKRPGESDGACRGEQDTKFSPTQARNLIVNADWVPADVRAAASAWTDSTDAG
jgi:endoglucanase